VALPAILAAACELGKVTIPTKPPSVVVHAVLNPSAPEQIVFLEHTLTGQTQVGKPMYDPTDPIASAGGIPVEFARVEIIDSSGTVVVGREQERGVYHVPIVGGLLRLGTRYQLHIRTQEGEDVTAFTRIPAPEVTTTGGLTRTVNRDHDTVSVSWSPAEQTRAYAMRVESPFGPFFLFTDSLHVRLTGELRNLFAGELQHVLVPGFHEDMLIAAVDSNFFDYYRTNNDPFTGTGIISRINGGIGLFGSLVTLTNGTLTVIADQTDPIEGRYRVTTGFNTAPAASINLYVESPPAKSGAPAALTGRYTAQSFTPHADGIVGTLRGTTVSFALLLNQLATDTADVFVGQLQNGTLTGAFQKAGPAVYVKQ
jgi:hypothetical protein